MWLALIWSGTALLLVGMTVSAVYHLRWAFRLPQLDDRAVPPNGMLLGNPQSTLLDADGSLWRIWHPNGFSGKYWTGSQPGQRFHDLMEQARITLVLAVDDEQRLVGAISINDLMRAKVI